VCPANAGVFLSPTGARVRSAVTWIARRKETESLKPIDQIVLWDDSEQAGKPSVQEIRALGLTRRGVETGSRSGS
jgi:hypothetical protein